MGCSFSNSNTSSNENEPTAMYTTSNYFPVGGYPFQPRFFHPTLRVLLCGVYNDEHPLSVFRGMRYLIQSIWQFAGSYDIEYDAKLISKYFDIPSEYRSISFYNGLSSPYFHRIDHTRQCDWSSRLDHLQFPEPLNYDININMMPFEMSNDYNTLSSQLPADLSGYIPYIQACLECDHTQFGKICYLTIHESFVEKGKSQRRPGLHIELPAAGADGQGEWSYGWGLSLILRFQCIFSDKIYDE